MEHCGRRDPAEPRAGCLGATGTREIFIPSECSQIRSEIVTTTLMEKLKKKRMDL